MTTPTAQLEIAAHWLREAARDAVGIGDSENLNRVADDCERVAKEAEKRGDEQ